MLSRIKSIKENVVKQLKLIRDYAKESFTHLLTVLGITTLYGSVLIFPTTYLAVVAFNQGMYLYTLGYFLTPFISLAIVFFVDYIAETYIN